MQDYLVEVSLDHLEHLVAKVGALSSPHRLSNLVCWKDKLTTELFFLPQVTKVVQASLVPQVILAYLDSKVTRESQVCPVSRVSQEIEGSLEFL